MGITHIDSSFKFSIGGNQRNGVEEGELKSPIFFFKDERNYRIFVCS